ncbi:MAG TPA: peptidoglycan DD-metalloendopeptidase family protein [Thermoanaerobaculia bacterium]
MRERRRLPHPFVSAILLLLLLLPAHAQTGDLERVRTEITRLRLRLEEVRKQTASAAKDLESVELELGIRTRELDLAVAAEQRLAAEQAAAEAEIAELGPQLERQQSDLRTRLVALYQLGGLSYVRLLLSIDQETDPVEAMSMLGYLVSRDARLVSRFQETRQLLGRRQSELAAQKERWQGTRAEVERQRQAVATAVVQKEQAVAKLRRDERTAERQIAELEEKAKRLQRLVEVLSQQKQGLDPDIDVRAVQGALPWPLRGKIVERFGRQRNPKFATFTVNNGIKVEAAPGTEVRAVFQGTVLFVQWFKGYGNLIILDHGNRVFSLYGNLKAPLVAVGDAVAAGQTIAGAGESEDAGAGYLYFEIRNDNRPEDPQKWLR